MLLECIDQNLRRHVLAQISHLEILGVHMDADLQVICEFITKLSALLEENRDIIDRVA